MKLPDEIQPDAIAPKRIVVPARVRFEVFKRDKFACQYCGACAPEVVLHCDHINPVSAGGTSDLLNLITSCAKCNSGKGAIPLDDNTAVGKQRAMMAELEERRQQLEMLVAWRDGLQDLQTTAEEAICDRIAKKGRLVPNEHGLVDIRRWLRRYKLSEILAAVDEAFDIYLRVDDTGQSSSESWNVAFAKVPTMIRMAQAEVTQPHIRRILYIQGIIRNRARNPRLQIASYLEELVHYGAEIEEMESVARRVRSFDGFINYWHDWLQAQRGEASE